MGNLEKEPMSIEKLYSIIEGRKTASPEESYVAKCFSRDPNQTFKKVGEEGTELAVAATKACITGSREDRQRVIEEAADVLFQTLMVLARLGIRPIDVFDELDKRDKTAGRR